MVILLKNQNTTKAVAHIKVDGMDILDGNSIIVEPNDSLELKGFMDGITVRNKFRFIEKTKKIYDFRGSRIDDGMIRVEYRFEKKKIKPIIYDSCADDFLPCTQTPLNYGGSICGMSTNSLNDNGITVKGAKTNQDFVYGIVGTLDSLPSIITILLKGRSGDTDKFVNKPLTVKTRITCPTCGTKSKSSAKFCRECGTFL